MIYNGIIVLSQKEKSWIRLQVSFNLSDLNVKIANCSEYVESSALVSTLVQLGSFFNQVEWLTVRSGNFVASVLSIPLVAGFVKNRLMPGDSNVDEKSK